MFTGTCTRDVEKNMKWLSAAALLQLCCGFPHFFTLDTSKTPIHCLPLPTSITSMLDTCMHAPYVPLLEEVETCKACAAKQQGPMH
jgi:hypothetical protein